MKRKPKNKKKIERDSHSYWQKDFTSRDAGVERKVYYLQLTVRTMFKPQTESKLVVSCKRV